MFLLIPKSYPALPFVALSLHSTMFLLIRRLLQIREEYRQTLHSTMFLLMLTSHFFPTHTLLLAKTKGFKVFC